MYSKIMFLAISMVLLWAAAKGQGTFDNASAPPPTISVLSDLWKKLKIFEESSLKYHSLGLEDSVYLTNRSFAAALSLAVAAQISVGDLKRTVDSAEISVHYSRDNKLTSISWEIENPSPTPPYCSNILVGNNRNPLVISLYGGGEDDFGENVKIDKIIDVIYDGKRYYLLFSSNLCGSLCTKKEVSICKITDGTVEKCSNCFWDGVDSSSNIEFEYSFPVKRELFFQLHLNDHYVLAPILNDNGDKMLGTKKYQIILD